MLFYYLALTYLEQGQLDSARSALKNAFSQDSFAELEIYRSDFYLMPVLESWLLMCEAREDDYKELLKRFVPTDVAIKYSNILPSKKRPHLTILDYGTSPVKEAVGKYLNILIYRNKKFRKISSITGQKSKKPYIPYIVGDTVFQAKTRGGRAIDAIVEKKVVFKENAKTTRNIALGAAAVSTDIAIHQAINTDDTDGAVAALAIAGVFVIAAVISEIAARSAATKADTRYWETFPSKIFFRAMHLTQVRSIS